MDGMYVVNNEKSRCDCQSASLAAVAIAADTYYSMSSWMSDLYSSRLFDCIGVQLYNMSSMSRRLLVTSGDMRQDLFARLLLPSFTE
jgi:hypothetical protein